MTKFSGFATAVALLALVPTASGAAGEPVTANASPPTKITAKTGSGTASTGLVATSKVTAPVPSAASAQTDAPPSDPRIRKFAYSESEVYRLDLFLRSVTALQFSPSEEVKSILIGDSASWEVVKLKAGNVVSIKPVIAGGGTNMTIYTDKRVYSFDLRSLGELPPGQEASSVSRTVFTYPAEKKPTPEVFSSDALAPSTDYMVAGTARFRPLRVQDNGRQTTFLMPPGAPRPAIFKVGFDKSEALVNSRTRGSLVIVDGLSDFWVLRIGDESVCVGRSGAIQQKRGFMNLEVARAGR